jgi:CheY-like chemotaxis protein
MANHVEQNSIVLVMDPADQAVKIIASTLRKAGYQVLLGSDPREALEECRATPHSVSLAIIDPETPGLAITEALAQLSPEVRVLIVADGRLLESAPDWAFSKRIRVSLTKPVRRTTLLGSVLKVANEPLCRTA